MTPRKVVRAGDKFGRWEVLREIPVPVGQRRRFECRCECGRTRTHFLLSLSKSQSCGCIKLKGNRFTGTTYLPKEERWVAYIHHQGQYLYLGSFHTDIEAARYYNSAALRLRGPKARLNVIPNVPPELLGEQEESDGPRPD